MAVEKMCRGWALGVKDSKKALLNEVEDDNETVDQPEKVPKYDSERLRKANQLRREMLLKNRGLSATGNDTKSISGNLKSAD